MSVSIAECVKSRHLSQVTREGELQYRGTRLYLIRGANDAVRTDVTSLAPLIGDAWLDSDTGTNDAALYCIQREYGVEHDGGGDASKGIIRLTATYGPSYLLPDPASLSNAGGAGIVSEVDIVCESVHIQNGISQDHYPSSETGPGVSINVTSSGVQGVDKLSPKINVTMRTQRATLSQAYIDGVAAAMAHINSGTFKGYAARTLLLIGLKASRRQNGAWDCVFSFLKGVHRTDNINTTAGGTQTVTKEAHDYAWEVSTQTDVSGTVTVQVESVHVTQVYYQDSFAALGL